MNRAAKKYGVAVGAVMAFFMIGGVVISGLGNNLGGGRSGPVTANVDTEKPLVTVGDQKITKGELDQRANDVIARQAAQNPMMGDQKPPPEQMDQVRIAALEIFKQQQALLVVGKDAHISVTSADIAAERDKEWAEKVRPSIAAQLQLDANADDNKIAGGLIKIGNGMTVDMLKRQFLPDDNLRIALIAQKLEAQLKTQVSTDEDTVRRSLSDMTVRHILVKFGTGALPEAQAQTKAEKLLAAVKADPTKMGDLAKTNSDDPGSKTKGGIYEWTPSDRQGIVPEFSAALDTLKPGETYPELVRVVSTGYSGFHIIRLESVKEGKTFPKDFAANKAKYLADYVATHVSQRIQKLVNAAVPSVPVTILDPQLKAEQDLEDAFKAASPAERDDKLNTALTELAKIDKKDDPLGIVPLKKAQIYTMQKKSKEAIAAYEEALADRSAPETRLALAQVYLDNKQKDKVKEQLTALEDGVIANGQMESQIASLYQQIGETEKSKAAQKKSQEMQQRQIQALLQQMQSQKGAPSPAPAAKK